MNNTLNFRFLLCLFILFSSQISIAEGRSWAKLNDSQQKALQPFKNQWDQLPKEKRKHILTGIKQWKTLSKGQSNPHIKT